jgi:hypothetical protein
VARLEQKHHETAHHPSEGDDHAERHQVDGASISQDEKGARRDDARNRPNGKRALEPPTAIETQREPSCRRAPKP